MPPRKKARPATKTSAKSAAKPAAKPAAKSARKHSTGSGSRARVAETASQPYRADLRETQISASEFKARCLELMDDVRDRHDTIIITKHGKPVAKLVPCDEEPRDIWGYMRGSVLWYGDLISPIDVEWDADK